MDDREYSAEDRLRLLLRELPDENLTEFFLLFIEDIEEIDSEAPLQTVSDMMGETKKEYTTIFFRTPNGDYTTFLFDAITFGILWEREDNPPVQEEERFEHPFGINNVESLLEETNDSIQMACLKAKDIYESNGVYPKADSFVEIFPEPWERHAFTVALSFGCLLQAVGKNTLTEFVY